MAKLDEGGLIFGGRFDILNQLFEYFFDSIRKTNARLVFMAALDEGRFYSMDHFSTNFDAFDCIKNQQSLKDHLELQFD